MLVLTVTPGGKVIPPDQAVDHASALVDKIHAGLGIGGAVGHELLERRELVVRLVHEVRSLDLPLR